MMTRLLSISCTDVDDEYDVVIEADGVRESMICRVVDRGGVRTVQARPDLMSSLPFSPRRLAAVVIAFDAACKAGG